MQEVCKSINGKMIKTRQEGECEREAREKERMNRYGEKI